MVGAKSGVIPDIGEAVNCSLVMPDQAYRHGCPSGPQVKKAPRPAPEISRPTSVTAWAMTWVSRSDTKRRLRARAISASRLAIALIR